MNNNKRIVVTGIGPISSLGEGASDVWKSIEDLHLNIVKERYLMNNEKWGEFYLHKI